MNTVIRHANTRPARWILAVFIFACVAIILRSTIAIPPVKPADVVIFVNHSAQTSALVEVRKFIGSNDQSTVTFSRYIYQEGNPQNFLQLAGGNFKAMRGEFPLLLSNRLPDFVTGRWCSQMTLAWQPSFSQREFYQRTPSVCFEVSDYE